MRRSNTVLIIAGKDTKAKLKALGKSFVDCWNEVNKLRLEQYKKHEPVDFNKTEKSFMKNIRLCYTGQTFSK
ncbi:MAG: hypothetical protein RXR51_02945 [Nitrososphaeria archaeon]